MMIIDSISTVAVVFKTLGDALEHAEENGGRVSCPDHNSKGQSATLEHGPAFWFPFDVVPSVAVKMTPFRGLLGGAGAWRKHLG